MTSDQRVATPALPKIIDLDDARGVDLLRTVTGLPRIPGELSVAGQQELVQHEAALLDFVKSYAHIVNSGDIEAVVAHYDDECVWISPRGRFTGTEAIRRNYGLYYSPVRWFNFWTNVTVRFVGAFDEAYVSAYQYSIGVTESEPLRLGAVSTDVWHVARRGASWQIVERRVDILEEQSHRLLPAGGA